MQGPRRGRRGPGTRSRAGRGWRWDRRHSLGGRRWHRRGAGFERLGGGLPQQEHPRLKCDLVSCEEPGQPFYRRLDLDRIGATGWSFGGAAAIQMTRDDPRVKAAVDQDGQLFGDVREMGTGRPVMLLHHGGDPPYRSADTLAAYRELIGMVDGWDRTMLERSAGDWYEVWIANTQHANFSDSPLFSSRTVAGALDPRRAHESINAYTLAFFERYLRGRDSDLLKGPTSPCPEVRFKKRP